jgi:hypothetical protein
MMRGRRTCVGILAECWSVRIGRLCGWFPDAAFDSSICDQDTSGLLEAVSI